MENALIVRSFFAALTLGCILAYVIAKKDKFLLFVFSGALSLAALALYASAQINIVSLPTSFVILNALIGLLLGLIFSLPLMVADFFSSSVQSLFKQKVSSLCLITTLGFIIVLSDLDYFSYFFSLLIKTSKYIGSDWKSFQSSNFLINLPNVGSYILPASIYFTLPLFGVILTLYLFIFFAKSTLPTMISPGLRESLKMAFVFCTLIFVFSSSSLYFYDLMRDLSTQVLK